MKSQAYWAHRAEERIEQAQAVGKVYEERLLGMYRNTLRNINRDIEKLVKRYAWSFDMSEEDALKLLQEPVSMEELRLLESRLALVKSPALKKEIQKRLEARAYAYRISREEALKYDLKMHLDQLAHKGEGVLRQGLEKVTEGAYKSILGDIKAQARERGIGLSFAKFDSSVFERIASQKWYGRNYSERVWRNLGKLERRLETTLFEGLVKGDNTKLIARQLSQDMAVGMYEAKRLVRTETTYYTNQVAMQGIEDAGLEYYQFLAAHDHRTSKICRELDGKVFHIKDAKVGVNYPPMHPHCRSTVVAWFGEEISEKERFVKYDDNNVDINYIESSEYENKFSGISESKVLDESLYKSAKEILLTNSGTKKESLHLLNMDTGKVLYKQMVNEEESAITYTDALLSAIEEARKSKVRICSIHNHPDGYPPTLDDGASALLRGYSLGVVVGHNGEVYSYTQADSVYSKGECIKIHDKIVKWVNVQCMLSPNKKINENVDIGWRLGLELKMKYERR